MDGILSGILVTGKAEREHLEIIDLVLANLEDAGLPLKNEKCYFLLSQVEYLGHLITAEGLKSTPEKLRGIVEAPASKNVSQLCSFIYGELHWKFLPNVSSLLAPL